MNSTDDLLDALDQMAAIKGKGAVAAKKALLQLCAPLKEWLRLAVEPTISFYIETLPKYDRHGSDTLEDSDRMLLQSLADRSLSGKAALQAIQDTMWEISPKSQELLRRVIQKDLRCGVGATLLNEVWPGIVRDFPYQRCTLPKDSNEGSPGWWESGVYVQLKADGMFANVDTTDDGVTIFSRQGTQFPAGSLGFLEQVLLHTLKLGTQTHGELTVYNADGLLERQIGNGILNSLAQGGELPNGHWVRFDAWDQIPLSAAVPKGRYDVPYKERFADLVEQINGEDGAPKLLRVIETRVVHSKSAVMEICSAYQKRKLEGAVAKKADAPWRDGDNKDQVKLKLEFEVDLKIKGFNPGKPGTRTEATFGSVVCATLDDKLEVGVHGFKREMEQWLHENRDSVLGKIMAVKANGIMEPTEDGGLYSLFLPRFSEIRRDKVEADTLERVQAQLEAAIA